MHTRINVRLEEMTKGKPGLEILFEDYYILVVNKPVDIVSDAANPLQVSVKSMAVQYLKSVHPQHKNWFVGIPHRLDKPVGGVMVIAKTPQALKHVSHQFAEHSTKKKYIAWIEGILEGQLKTLAHFTGRDKAGKKALISVTEKKDFRPCSLFYTAVKTHGDKTLVEIELVTGRYHQIRAQFSFMGHPIYGDTLYGAAPAEVFGLWSQQLTITHPKSGEEMIFRLPEEQLQKITAGYIF